MPQPEVVDLQPEPHGWLVRHRRVLLVWAALGLLAGTVWGLLTPAHHTAEARLLVGTFEAPSVAIPGYVLASQTIAANYARIAQSATVTDDLRTRLGEDPASSSATVTVTAIPESAILRVRATGPDAEDARTLADAMAGALTDTVQNLNTVGSGEDLLRQYEEAARTLATATTAQQAAQAARTAVPAGSAPDVVSAAQTALDQANLAVSTAQLRVEGLRTQYTTQQQTLSTSAQITPLGEATVAEDSRLKGIATDAVLGALLGAGIGALIGWRADRRRRRRRASASAGEDAPTDEPVPAGGTS